MLPKVKKRTTKLLFSDKYLKCFPCVLFKRASYAAKKKWLKVYKII